MLALLTAVILNGLAGCATVHEGRLDPGLFPDSNTAAKAPGGVALLLPEEVASKVVLGEHLNDVAGSRVRVPIGEIVRAAAQAAFDAELEDGLYTEGAGGVGQQAEPATAIIEVQGIEYAYRDEIVFFAPLPLPSVTKLSVQLAVMLEVRDAGGRALWSKRYDSGWREWQGSSSLLSARYEERTTAVMRMTHEIALELMQAAVSELRSWLEADALRERQL